MIKTSLGAQRYNNRMNKIFKECQEANKREAQRKRDIYRKAFDDIHELNENQELSPDSKEAKVLVLLSQLQE